MIGELTVDSSIVITFIKNNDVYKITYKEDNKDKEIRGFDLLNKYIRFIESNDNITDTRIHIDVEDVRKVYSIIWTILLCCKVSKKTLVNEGCNGLRFI